MNKVDSIFIFGAGASKAVDCNCPTWNQLQKWTISEGDKGIRSYVFNECCTRPLLYDRSVMLIGGPLNRGKMLDMADYIVEQVSWLEDGETIDDREFACSDNKGIERFLFLYWYEKIFFEIHKRQMLNIDRENYNDIMYGRLMKICSEIHQKSVWISYNYDHLIDIAVHGLIAEKAVRLSEGLSCENINPSININESRIGEIRLWRPHGVFGDKIYKIGPAEEYDANRFLDFIKPLEYKVLHDFDEEIEKVLPCITTPGDAVLWKKAQYNKITHQEYNTNTLYLMGVGGILEKAASNLKLGDMDIKDVHYTHKGESRESYQKRVAEALNRPEGSITFYPYNDCESFVNDFAEHHYGRNDSA